MRKAAYDLILTKNVLCLLSKSALQRILLK